MPTHPQHSQPPHADRSPDRLIAVAVPVPGLDLLTYRVPADQVLPAAGARVVAPLGRRFVTGIVIGPARVGEVPDAGVKAIKQVLDAGAFIPAAVVDLARWTAEYYAAGPGETILSALPPMARGARADAHKHVRLAAITAGGRGALDEARGLSARQREALTLLAGAPDGLPTPELSSRGVSSDVLARLVRHGFVHIGRARVDRDPFEPTGASPSAPPGEPAERALTIEQAEAVRRLRALAATGTFRVALVHGVTGSGKTEVYLRVAAAVRQEGRGVLMLVPEIALTPALAGLCRQAFGGRVAIQHSALSDGERHDQWQRIRRGDVDVVVGTRSAVFAPLERVGLVIVDEEHDGSYKQEESPRYHGRDVAIVRAQRAGALVMLGSATPSLESYQHAATGRYERVVLERRILDRPLAGVTVVDMREEYAEAGPDVILSRALAAGLGARVGRGEQALVLLNRRGFATAVFCRQCAGSFDCPNCSVALVVHGEGTSRRARCHYCNYSIRIPPTCPVCAGPYLEQSGFGTERVEAEVRQACPGATVARLDRDAIRRKGALTALLEQFRSGRIDVLVGTQMIAKGHDFPRVTLVGVVSADVGLGLADFRASERTFQLLTQVAGRAGRGEQPGEAIVQTLYPTHYSIQLACRQDYVAFFDKEIDFRRRMHYPPLASLINVIVRGRSLAGAMDDATSVVDRLRKEASSAFAVLGPAPAPLGRLRGEYRVQFLVKGKNRREMRERLLAALATRPDVLRRTVVDVDPVSVL